MSYIGDSLRLFKSGPLVRFPMDLDVRCKATLIGAAFLIDYMFFEKKANNEGDGFGMAS